MLNKMKFMGVLIGLAMLFVPFATSPAAAQPSGPWTVEYFNTTNLTGPVAYSAQVNTVGFEWTAGAPVPNVNPNFFSARWTSVQDLRGGTYQVVVQADDGVRVFVNNVPLINEFHAWTGETYTETFNLTAGQHVFRVEYYEDYGGAFLDFQLSQVSGQPDPNEPYATVFAGRLNVREDPVVIQGNVITQVSYNETYPVTGRTADSSWWRIIVDGVTGWVSGQWVSVVNAGTVPVVDDEVPEQTGYTLTATGNLNIRSGPGVIYGIVGWLPYQATAEIIGRNAANTWWQIQYGDVTGWVSGVYSQLEVGVDITEIPVTEGAAQTRTLTANVNLNIRSGPGVIYGIVGWLPYQATAEVIGRNAATTWWQIQYGDVTGWVSGFYTSLEAGVDPSEIPVTG